ncbi:MAG: MAPEG family protein [Alphaproteobacteria bacterium]|nr:MAPEG family protein [Alphaproteobacteria bacterium]
MTSAAILAPVFVQVLLTFALLIATGRKRVAAVKARKVKVSDIAVGQRNWPAEVAQVSNSFDNQFQLPVLFYALTAFVMITNKGDLTFVILSWIFVATRILHTWVYVTSNNIRYRFRNFLAGAIVLMIMWAVFALQLVDWL